MELIDAVRSRRMVRSFSDQPLDPDLVTGLLTDSLLSPTAGNTRGTAWLWLAGPEETAGYWDRATTAAWRARSSRWAGMSRAPVVALSLTRPDAYVRRYQDPDKGGSPLGDGPGSWPVPYWFGDAAFATMSVLLGASDRALGACFLGNFRNEDAVLSGFGVPDGWRLFGTVLLGHPDGNDHRSTSLARPGPVAADRIHRGHWRRSG
ncbi:MAG: nitroreductase family protein [Acidimicrobiales bacterium]